MKNFQLLFLAIFLIFNSCKNTGTQQNESSRVAEEQQEAYTVLLQDTIIHHLDFPSEFVDSRNVEVWLPPGYTRDPAKRFKVLYMHDGQNVFHPSTASGNVEWAVDEIMDSLVKNNLIPATIVVAIWNNGRKRFPEYMPQVKEQHVNNPQAQKILKEGFGVTELLSDKYLQFIVEELKPFIDSTYNTSISKENTAIMGSSMGGLISLYALTSYPEIFGAAGCVSTHWPVPLIGEVYINELTEALPEAGKHRIYFDYGTTGLDADYEPYQLRVDEIMKEKGYEENEDWITRKFEGAGHNEASWKKRAHIPLEFLLK